MNQTETPTQVLLPGQAAAPEGPCDMTGMYVMHHAFRRDLTRFARAVPRTPIEDRRTWSAMARRWSDFARELHHHHTKEDDAIWPLLVERVGDGEDRLILEAMAVEHDAIDPLLARIESGLARLRTTADVSARDDLAAAFRTLRAVLDAHLAHEETAAIPLIQVHVTGAEWTHLEETQLRAKGSPRQLMFLLPWVADELPLQTLARLLGGAPLPVRVLLALGGRSYARGSARAFGHR